MKTNEELLIDTITRELVFIISETNGLTLDDTLELLSFSPRIQKHPHLQKAIEEFQDLIIKFNSHSIGPEEILSHDLSKSLFCFFKNFALPFHEEHIHLTGSLSADFIWPRLKPLIQGPHKDLYNQKISTIYPQQKGPIQNQQVVEDLIGLSPGQGFKDYLKILYIPKLILTDRKAHEEASYHMAKDMWNKYNVGHMRLKFTLSRATSMSDEQLPNQGEISEEDVLLGLYQGLERFRQEVPHFSYILSPCFRKEAAFFDAQNFKSKVDHFNYQVDELIKLTAKHPYLKEKVCEVDTVGDEKELYRKAHFEQMREGLRRLQYNGFSIRSHHGETWKTLKRGIQSIDNAMNIWHIDTLEHALAIGINPNYYFHALYQRVMEKNGQGLSIAPQSSDYQELEELEWKDRSVFEKLIKGERLNLSQEKAFIKAKFYTAREVEHYQHDILNRMIHKNISLVSLPSSNMKLTENFPNFKNHPFSWWEKKGVDLGVGTDNYITLQTNYIQELLILLFSDSQNIKITKLLMVATKEKRRAYMAHLLWEMRRKFSQDK